MPATILIADDHAEMRQTLRDWAQLHFPACSIRTATSGEEAIALAQSEPPQLVIMDVGLPGINGFEAARQIRGKSPAVRIVMLGIHDAACYRAEAATAGAAPTYRSTECIPTSCPPCGHYSPSRRMRMAR